MKIIYHDDLDGRCAAAIVASSLADDGPVDFIPWDIHKPLRLPTISPDEQVAVLDLQLREAVMRFVLGLTKRVLWIDHHLGSEDMEKQCGQKIEGIRDASGGHSAAWLAWNFCLPDIPMPEAVKLVEDWDLHTVAGSLYGERTRCFGEGCRRYDTKPTGWLWGNLLGGDRENLLNTLCDEGAIALDYRNALGKEISDRYGFKGVLSNGACGGGPLCWVVNMPLLNPGALEKQLQEHDCVATIAYDGTARGWDVRLYTERAEIDVADWARKLGGDGHRRQAGFFWSERLPPFVLVM